MGSHVAIAPALGLPSHMPPGMAAKSRRGNHPPCPSALAQLACMCSLFALAFASAFALSLSLCLPPFFFYSLSLSLSFYLFLFLPLYADTCRYMYRNIHTYIPPLFLALCLSLALPLSLCLFSFALLHKSAVVLTWRLAPMPWARRPPVSGRHGLKQVRKGLNARRRFQGCPRSGCAGLSTPCVWHVETGCGVSIVSDGIDASLEGGGLSKAGLPS